MSRQLRASFRYLGSILAVCALVTGGQGRASTTLSLTQTAYDADDRPVCTAVRLNLATTATDACTPGPQGGNDPDRITRTVYDPDGETVEVKRAVGTPDEQIYATYTYTHNGQKASESDANGNVSRMVYDGFDRLQYLFYPSPSVTRTTQPCVATPETWCNGAQPYTARAAGVAATPLLGATSATDYEQFGYDANDNKTSWRRRNGYVHTYSYDALNRQWLDDLPAYPGNGNNATASDVYTAYDLKGEVCDKIFATDTIGSGDDCTTRLSAVAAAGIHNAYDNAGRLVSTKDINGRTLTYAYVNAVPRSSMTFPDGVVQAYQYYASELLQWTGVNGTSLGITPGYDARDRLTSVTRSNSANTNIGYDDLNRVTSLSHTVSNAGYNAGWSFAYNAASQITSLTSTNAVYDYVEAAKSTENPTYDGLNRDASIAAVAGGYDANGNLANEGAGGRAMTYDMDNRLLTVTGGTAPVTMSYDPTGRLASYTAGSTTTQFLYDGVNLIGEYVGGVMQRRYMHTTGMDQPFVEFAGTGTAATDASFLLANYQGSIIALTNSGGAVDTTRVFRYGPYGEPTDINGNPAWGGERFGYTGQTVLPEARLYYYKARVYDPKYGRFLQTDPVGSKDDLDLYAYTGDDPVNRSDPLGLQAVQKPDSTECGFSGCRVERQMFQQRQAANDNDKSSGNTGNGLFGVISSIFKGAGFTAAATNATEQANASMRTQGAVDAQQRDPKSYVWVARFYGGKSGPYGQSWMPLGELQSVGNNAGAIRERWGIGGSNTMDRVVIGLMRTQDVNNPALVTQRAALEWDGYKGGGTEYYINNRDSVPVLVVPVADRPF